MVAMMDCAGAPSGSIHGSLPYLNTSASSPLQYPACAQIARLSWIVIRWPEYVSLRSRSGSASFALEKPIFLCVPSQNGLLADAPQRQSANTACDAMTAPSAPLRFGRSFTRYGPFGLASIRGG